MISDRLLNLLRWLTGTGEAFLNGVQAKLDKLAGSLFGGRAGPVVRSDQSGRFSHMLANAGLYDGELAVRTPADPMLRCDVRHRWWRRTRVAAVVAVDLAEVLRRVGGEHDASADWPALSGEALAGALGEFREGRRRTFVGLASPSGFSDEALERAGKFHGELSARGGGLVLLCPRADGGWTTFSVRPGEPPQRGPTASWHLAFDPEPEDEKTQRVRAAISSGVTELADSGLRDAELAGRLDVPVELVRRVFEEEARGDSMFRVRQLDGEHVLLGPADFAVHGEERVRSMFDRLRELLGLRGQEERKIEMLADRRALLTSRRDRIYRELEELAERERSARQRGIASDSAVTRRHLARELAEVRRRIEQGSSLADLFNRQIDVLSTHIHHLTLLSQGQSVPMPDVEVMTRDAVRAEELLERVKGEAGLVESLAQAAGVALTSTQEEEILAEFEAARGQKAPAQAEKPSTAAEAAPQEKKQEPGREQDRPIRE